MIAVDRDIPRPAQDCRTKYPFMSLEIGESFFASAGSAASVRVRACIVGRERGRKFCTRKTRGGIRVWRTA